MGHWMTDVNGDDYYVEDKGRWVTDVNGDDHYVKGKDHWITRLCFGENNYLEVDAPIEVIMSKIKEGYTWFHFTETFTRSTCIVNIKTVQYIREYPGCGQNVEICRDIIWEK